ncbi:YoaK family protein [Francisella sp. 19X1-34]|uniref:YoaK family protein n=1 Tax=Francisella sp. 19X1-34 TaxID=3087177 RepID=UPI002E2F038E|nr:YoaK family protein [Francisella sp. 19X1-34]MED7787941.1 YoaK family protein [Francisella sp. 19X1-34]
MFTKKMAFTYFITVILIFNSGWIDSVVLYNSFGASVAVMSGNLRILGHSIAGEDWVFVYKVAVLVFGFVVGAAVNGVIMKTDAYVISEDHTKTLVLQSAVMLTGTLLIDIFSNHRIIDDLFLAVAMGMQNSFTTIFFGGFARTTHMTGTTTDLGIEIGRVLRGDKSNIWKIPFFATCMTMFVIGNAVGFAWVRISGEHFTLMLFPSVILPIFVGIVILLAYNMKIRNHTL